MKARIAGRLETYDLTVTGEVVKQEFKRRVLMEARYLLELLNTNNSFQQTRRRVVSHLTKFQDRKRNICLETLETIQETLIGPGIDEGVRDSDLTERAKSFLGMLIRFGLARFERDVGHLEKSLGCAASRRRIAQKKNGAFDFGPDKCSKSAEECGVANFLSERIDALKAISEYLASLQQSEKSDELKKTEEVVREFISNVDDARNLNPCSTVGDLLIALESKGIPDFYTMNYKESQHLCKVFGQSMIYRPTNDTEEDVECLAQNEDWKGTLTSARSSKTKNPFEGRADA
jgi:hypothetical protein